jgi:hypothetical protein
MMVGSMQNPRAILFVKMKRKIHRWESKTDTKLSPNNYIYNIIYWKVGSIIAVVPFAELRALCCYSQIPSRLPTKGRGEIRQINWFQMSQKKGNVRQEQDDLYIPILNFILIIYIYL